MREFFLGVFKKVGEKIRNSLTINASVLAIGGIVLLTAISLISAFTLQHSRQTQKSRAITIFELSGEGGDATISTSPITKPDFKPSCRDIGGTCIGNTFCPAGYVNMIDASCLGEKGVCCVNVKRKTSTSPITKPVQQQPIPPAQSKGNSNPKPKRKPTPTSRPKTSASTSFTILLKFQGINGLPKSGVRKMPVKVGLQRVGSSKIDYKVVNFRVDERGVWTGKTSYNISTGNYFIFIKGPKHIGKKICDLIPREGYPGAYKCSKPEGVKLESGKRYNLNLTGMTLLAGDLPEQDGLVNSYDISLVRNLLGKTDANSVALADVNLDGVVDTQDFALIQAALSVRYDDY